MRLIGIASLLVLVAIALPSVVAVPDRCTRIQQRREIRTLSQEERSRFFNAFRRLQSARQPNTWDRYTQMHLNATNTAHGYSWFFSWHRAFLRSLEKELQRTDERI